MTSDYSKNNKTDGNKHFTTTEQRIVGLGLKPSGIETKGDGRLFTFTEEALVKHLEFLDLQPQMYWIWSIENNGWWGPASGGYFADVAKAGVYMKEDAEGICKDANREDLREIMVPVSCPVHHKLIDRTKG